MLELVEDGAALGDRGRQPMLGAVLRAVERPRGATPAVAAVVLAMLCSF